MWEAARVAWEPCLAREVSTWLGGDLEMGAQLHFLAALQGKHCGAARCSAQDGPVCSGQVSRATAADRASATREAALGPRVATRFGPGGKQKGPLWTFCHPPAQEASEP